MNWFDKLLHRNLLNKAKQLGFRWHKVLGDKYDSILDAEVWGREGFWIAPNSKRIFSFEELKESIAELEQQ